MQHNVKWRDELDGLLSTLNLTSIGSSRRRRCNSRSCHQRKTRLKNRATLTYVKMSMNEGNLRSSITLNRRTRNGIISERHRQRSRTASSTKLSLKSSSLTRYLRKYDTRIRNHLVSVKIRTHRTQRRTRRCMKNTRNSINGSCHNMTLQCTRYRRRRRRQSANSSIKISRKCIIRRISHLSLTILRIMSTCNNRTTRRNDSKQNCRDSSSNILCNARRQIQRTPIGRINMRLRKRTHPITRRLHLNRQRSNSSRGQNMRSYRRRPRVPFNWCLFYIRPYSLFFKMPKRLEMLWLSVVGYRLSVCVVPP